MNKLLAFRDDIFGLIKEIIKNIFNFLIFIPQLVKDLFVKEDTTKINKSESAIEDYLNKLNEAIRSQEYSLISQKNPIFAIDKMKDSLQVDPKGLPFFDEKTLKTIKNYILDLEAKEPGNAWEPQLITEYHKIITERDERVSCVEQAIMQGNDIATHLICRKDNSENLKWGMVPVIQSELLVENFFAEYTKLREKETGPLFFKTNFIKTIKEDLSSEEKLRVIRQHILENPESRSASAWKKCDVRQETWDILCLQSLLQEEESILTDKPAIGSKQSLNNDDAIKPLQDLSNCNDGINSRDFEVQLKYQRDTLVSPDSKENKNKMLK